MAWLISVLGVALALGGAYSLWNGVSYIRLDWGQAETVAGTVALSAGIVTLALGAVLFTLRGMARDVAARAAARPSGVGMEALTWGEDDAPAPRPLLSRVTSRLATVGVPKAREVEPELAAPAPTGSAARPTPAPESLPEPSPVETPGIPREPGPTPMEAPTVVGRYEANGASYVLFSDGTIEVETDSGTHRFSSMTELKDHIERQGER